MPMQGMQRAALFLTLLVLLVSLSLTMGVAQAQQPATVSGQVDWSPDGKLLAVANWRGLTLYNANLQPSTPAIANIGSVLTFSWSPDSRYIVTVHFDAVARIWDTQTGQIVSTLTGHTDRLIWAAWSPDRTKIATSSYDHSVRIWDVTTGNTIKTIPLGDDTPLGIAWSPDSKRIAFVKEFIQRENADVGSVVIWSLDTNSVISSFTNDLGGRTLLWRVPDKLMINGSIVDATAGVTIVWTPTGPDRCPFTTGPTASTWSNDGSRAAYANAWVEAGSKMVCVVDVSSMDVTRLTRIMLVTVQDKSFRRFGSLALSPDGKTIVAVSDNGGVLQGWDTATGKQITIINAGTPTAVAQANKLELTPLCSPNTTQVRQWRVRNTNSFAVAFMWTLQFNSEPGQSFGYVTVPAAVGSTPGEVVFTTPVVGYKNSLSIYSPTDVLQDTKVGIDTLCPTATGSANPTQIGQAPVTIVTPTQAVQAQQPAPASGQVDWSPDGKLLAVANSQGLTLYDANLKPALPAISNIGPVINFNWSSDSRYIVTVHRDAIARIWDVQTGKIIRTLEGHTERLTGAAWGHNNTQIATTSYDYSIRIWDAATGKTTTVIPLQSQYATPFGLAWMPTGSVIAASIVLAPPRYDAYSKIWLWNLNSSPDKPFLSGSIENTFGGTAIFWRSFRYIMVNGVIIREDAYSSILIFPSPLDPPPCTTAPSAATWSYDAAYVVYAGVEADSKIVCVIDVSQMTTTRPKQVMVVRVKDDSFKQFGSVSINSEGKTVVALSDDDETLYMWETATGKQLKLLKLDAPMPTPSASPTR